MKLPSKMQKQGSGTEVSKETRQETSVPNPENGPPVRKPARERDMKLRNFLIVVNDIAKSRQFYHDLFGLQVLVDFDGNMIMTEELVLQDRKIWEKFTGREVTFENNSSELYFEESEIESFAEKLEKLYPDTVYVNRLMTHSWGQKVIRFYDPDGNLIEVGTPME